MIVDGNRATSPGIVEFTQQLGDDIEYLANRGAESGLPEAMTAAFRYGSQRLSGPHNRDQVLHALEAILDRLPGQDARMLVLVFDNLDHLNPESAESAFQLARDVNLAHGIGSILCLRPSLFRLIGDRGGARQIINTFERVYPPTLNAWLEAFPDRMKQALRELQRDTPRVAHDTRITLAALERACQRFASLVLKTHRRDNVKPRHPEDDPTEFLESVSAQDMRHLTALVRRMLENHRLPSEWLLSIPSSSGYEAEARFHPLSAAMEGGWRCYQHSRYVTNVLCFEMNGDSNVLILHRLLCLLSDNEPQRLEHFLEWTAVFGYEPRLTIEALEVLRTGNLVYGSNLDVTWSTDVRPEFCGLTEGGKYFLNHLLSNADYLTAAVMDVRLEHRFLTESPKEFFPARLHSLMEYLKEVRKRENRQISDLKRSVVTSALKVVVDRLRNGGTLTAKITKGLMEAIARARNSESFKVREVALGLQGKVAEFQGVVESMEEALWEVRQKAMKHIAPVTVQPVEIQDADSRSDMRVQFVPVGDEIEASLTLHTNETATGALACVLDQERGEQIATAFLQLKGSSSDSATLAGKVQYTPSESSPSSPPTIQSISLSIEDRPIAVLSTSRNRQGGAKVELCMWDRKGLKRDEVGDISNCDSLCAWSSEKLEEVGKNLLENKLGESKIRGIGTELGNRVLSMVGRNRLSQIVNIVDRCLIVTDMREVPWEWLVFKPGNDARSISDEWDTVRWHPGKSETSFHRMPNRISGATELTFYTIGVPIDARKKWHLGVPEHLDQLLQWLHAVGGKHIIVHHKGGKYQLGHQFWLSCEDILGNPPGKDYSSLEVVLSGCNAGALADPNLAVIFAEQWGCCVWAPLTELNPEHAAKVDELLAASVFEEKIPIAAGMRSGRDRLPLLKLYVQYAVQAS